MIVEAEQSPPRTNLLAHSMMTTDFTSHHRQQKRPIMLYTRNATSRAMFQALVACLIFSTIILFANVEMVDAFSVISQKTTPTRRGNSQQHLPNFGERRIQLRRTKPDEEQHDTLLSLVVCQSSSSPQDQQQQAIEDTDDEDTTVATITSNDKSKCITLIGTAHLSKKSNEQVKSLIDKLQPNIVMIELDPTRLERIGIKSIESIQKNIPNVVASGDTIVLPKEFTKDNPLSFKVPFFLQPIQNAIVEAITLLSRKLLTGMYNDMSKEMNNNNDDSEDESDDEDVIGGGEFLAAIRSAEKCTNCNNKLCNQCDIHIFDYCDKCGKIFCLNCYREAF